MKAGTSKGQELPCSASRILSEDLSTFYANDLSVFGDLDHGEMTGFFLMKASQVGPVAFDFRA